MHRKKRWLVAGATAAALVAVVGIAAAKSAHLHTMAIGLPDGSVAEVRYQGDVPPQVSIGPPPVDLAAWVPAAAWDDPFAELDRIAAQMDRQAAMLLREAEASEPDVAAGPGPGFTYAATGAGAGVCGRSVEITADVSGKAPKVVTHTWGDCAAAAPARPGAATSVPAAPADGLIRTGSSAPAPSDRKSPI